MFFALDDDQRRRQSEVRRLLEESVPEGETRRLMAGEVGYDPALWRRMVHEQGLLPPRDTVDLALVAEEMGRALYGGPYLSTGVLGLSLLSATTGDDPTRRLLGPAATGERVLAVASRGGHDAVEVTATPAGDHGEHRLSGEARYVVDGHRADDILVLARDGDTLDVFAVAGDDPTVARELLPTLDLTRKQARLRFTAASGTTLRWPVGTDATEAWRQTMLRTRVALAAEALGGAEACLSMTVDYAKSREQFGTAIGGFQAVGHAAAEMLLDVESARSATYYAAWAADHSSAEFPRMATLAAAVTTEAFLRVARWCIQLQGGIGFTWDNPAHLYLKRAKSTALLFGDPAAHRRALAGQLGYTAASGSPIPA